MGKAEAKSEELVEGDQFEVKNAKDDTIMALQTQVLALSTEVSRLKKPNGNGGDGTPQKDGKHCQKGVPVWMSKPPHDGEAKTKKVEGKSYNWCEGYGTHEPRWVIHKVENCCGYIKRLQELGGEANPNAGEQEDTVG